MQNSCFSCYFKVLILIHLLISGKPCVIYIYNYIFIYIINIVTTLSKLELKNKSKSLCLCIIHVEITVIMYEIAELNLLRPSDPFKIEKNGIKWPFSAYFLRLCPPLFIVPFASTNYFMSLPFKSTCISCQELVTKDQVGRWSNFQVLEVRHGFKHMGLEGKGASTNLYVGSRRGPRGWKDTPSAAALHRSFVIGRFPAFHKPRIQVQTWQYKKYVEHVVILLIKSPPSYCIQLRRRFLGAIWQHFGKMCAKIASCKTYLKSTFSSHFDALG